MGIDKIHKFFPEELMKIMKAKGAMKGAQFPPKVFDLVPSQFIEYKKGAFLKLRFPIREDYNNPFSITFGGIYGMFFDAVFGPFSGLESDGPTTSLDMNVTFLKPTSVKDQYVDITASLVSKSKTFIIVNGTAHNASGALIATCTSRMMIMDLNRMNKKKI